MAETKTYNEVFNYLRDNEYPIDFSKDQKRNLRKKALKYVLEDGALYFIGQKKGEPKRWVHCQDEQQKILRACHSDKLAGHFGRDKTREKVCTKFNATCLDLLNCGDNLLCQLLTVVLLLFFQVTSRYYWARVLEDCDETVKRCDVCQRTSKKFEKPSAQLHPIKVKDTVWHRISIGLVGPLPETSRGNKYLITCTCYFSKWPEAAPLKSKSAEGMWYPILKLVVTN